MASCGLACACVWPRGSFRVRVLQRFQTREILCTTLDFWGNAGTPHGSPQTTQPGPRRSRGAGVRARPPPPSALVPGSGARLCRPFPGPCAHFDNGLFQKTWDGVPRPPADGDGASRSPLTATVPQVPRVLPWPPWPGLCLIAVSVLQGRKVERSKLATKRLGRERSWPQGCSTVSSFFKLSLSD